MASIDFHCVSLWVSNHLLTNISGGAVKLARRTFDRTIGRLMQGGGIICSMLGWSHFCVVSLVVVIRRSCQTMELRAGSIVCCGRKGQFLNDSPFHRWGR